VEESDDWTETHRCGLVPGVPGPSRPLRCSSSAWSRSRAASAGRRGLVPVSAVDVEAESTPPRRGPLRRSRHRRGPARVHLAGGRWRQLRPRQPLSDAAARQIGDDMTVAERHDLLTPAEVAELFRVNPKTVTRWARAGKITAVRTPPPAVPQGRDRGAAALRTLHRRL